MPSSNATNRSFKAAALMEPPSSKHIMYRIVYAVRLVSDRPGFVMKGIGKVQDLVYSDPTKESRSARFAGSVKDASLRHTVEVGCTACCVSTHVLVE